MASLVATTRISLAAALLLLSGCAYSGGSSETWVVPEQGTISHWKAFPRSGHMVVTHFPDGGLALYSSSSDGDGTRLVEGYDDTLGLLWNRVYRPRYEDEVMLWFGSHSRNVVTAWRSWQTQDSMAVWAHSYDGISGEPRDSARLALFSNRSRDQELTVHPTQIIPSSDSSLLAAYTVDLLPARRSAGFDSVRVRLQMIDMGMRQRGSVTLMPAILHIAEAKDATYRMLGNPLLDNDGRFYMALATGDTTVTILQVDIERGTTSSIDITTPMVYPQQNAHSLQGMQLQLVGNGKIMVAATEHFRGNSAAITLYRVDFQRRGIDFTRRLDFGTDILAGPETRVLRGGLRLREMLPCGRHGTLVLMEQAASHSVAVRSGRGLGMGTTDYYSTGTSSYGDLIMIMADDSGGVRWSAVQKRPTMYASGSTDLWRIDGDTLHYLTRNVLAGTVDLTDGSMTLPRLLLSTAMSAHHQYSRWLDSRGATILLATGSYNSLVSVRY